MASTIIYGRLPQTETQLHAQCFQWYWNEYRHGVWKQALHHNDNNSINSIEGNKKKAMGVIPGVSDFELVLPGGMLFIEMKIPGGKQSQEQKDFQEFVESCGHEYIIIFSFEEFKNKIYGTLGNCK
jgi:hypothetical protein